MQDKLAHFSNIRMSLIPNLLLERKRLILNQNSKIYSQKWSKIQNRTSDSNWGDLVAL